MIRHYIVIDKSWAADDKLLAVGWSAADDLDQDVKVLQCMAEREVVMDGNELELKILESCMDWSHQAIARR